MIWKTQSKSIFVSWLCKTKNVAFGILEITPLKASDEMRYLEVFNLKIFQLMEFSNLKSENLKYEKIGLFKVHD